MSIINSIANCKVPIASGADREIFYSKRYDLVIKRPKLHYGSYYDLEQTENELRVINNMTEMEKYIFPVIDVIDYKGQTVVTMKKCIPLYNHPLYFAVKHIYTANFTMNTLNQVCYILDLNPAFNLMFYTFAQRFGLIDLHCRNVGVLDNHLVILDAGY